jgi:uridine monophosphate synthetase
MDKAIFIRKLVENKFLKFGKFTLKNGKTSPFYFDLRDTFSETELFRGMVSMMVEKVKNLSFDAVVGIPYTATPFAVMVADALNKPFLAMRKEEKEYGTKGSILGKFQKGWTCLVIDDVVTTGESKISTARALEKEGIVVKDFAVFIDRGYKSAESLAKAGYNLHCILQLNEVIDLSLQMRIIDETQAAEMRQFTLSLQEENTFAEALKKLRESKKTNLIASIDVTRKDQFLEIAKIVGPHVLAVKTHIDIIEDFDFSFIRELKKYSAAYNFYIIEDRKFADIGYTARKQFREGFYKISSWADGITVHGISGEYILRGMFDEEKGETSGGVFLLSRMSSAGNLISEDYTNKILEIGKNNVRLVAGYIGSGISSEDLFSLRERIPSYQLLLVPGVSLDVKKDNQGQTYLTVSEALKGGADCLIVGRGIYKDGNIEKNILQYKKEALVDLY